jgi:hypothetical protein
MSTGPFGIVDAGQDGKAPNLLQYEFQNLMQEIFGFSGKILSSDFLREVQKAFIETKGSRRCSAARALFVGLVAEASLPLKSIPHTVKVRLEKALRILDLFETMRLVAAKRSVDPNVRKDLEMTEAIMGG